MKFLKRFVLLVLLVLLAAIVVGYLLPDNVQVERSISIRAEPLKIFPYVNNFREFNKWQPWAQSDPSTEYVFEGPESGAGAKMSWSGQTVGRGTNQIMESRPPELVRVRMKFEGQGGAEAYFRITPKGDTSVVHWGFDSDLGNNPINRYFGLLMDRWVGGDYEKGLENLKALVEGSDG